MASKKKASSSVKESAGGSKTKLTEAQAKGRKG